MINNIIQFIVTSVVQEGKKLTINYSPMTMIWFDNQLIKSGLTTNIAPYCKACMDGLHCIRLYGATGIGGSNIEMQYAFNCTVVV
ncbi:hypothetical protein DFA_10436 [Cavenderia fasciculata]|uniref:Uncharacterized protein n=1 Tax=Cavenderia fasciculata TaxID=261658 RepID=F4QA75_CACFS|nr:uncharacterized protein DFA_10436 [Cavenderia fasciculata]EGG15594.1 hypothetical protein DFA_10436 [Cavenderia fasciculata]|eukprot:XP_004354336.1 hypothetical protein DFA_10436 [Cavenderia fasciculata]